MTDFLYKISPFLQIAYQFIQNIIPLIVAIVLHELSHGVVAYMLGDDTAKRANRLNLYNHFDFYGSFVIPVGLYLMHCPFMIGYAKPVPVDPRNFKRPINDMAMVAIAGPACNLLLAIVGSMFVSKDLYTITFTQKILINFIAINLGLFFFNLIPIPPLDGSRILAAFLPLRLLPTFYKYEGLGFFIIIGVEVASKYVAGLFGSNLSLFDFCVVKPLMITLRALIS